jgi:hypothetical protein
MKPMHLRILGVLAFIGLLWASSYLKTLDPLNALRAHLGADAMPQLVIRFKDAKLVGWSRGKMTWRFNSDRVNVNKDRTRASFEGGIIGEMFKDGRSIARIKSEKIVYNILTNDLSVPDLAEFTLDKGPFVKARKVYWNAGRSTLTCQAGVDAVLNPGTVHGEKLFLDLAKKEITITKVNGTIKLEE